MSKEENWLLEEKYHGEKTEGFFTDCSRLMHGEPLAYVIGSIPFLNTTIYLDSCPLIPRTETEFWVADIIKMMSKRKTPARVLDLCAGSGCIGVAVLCATDDTCVDFVEIDIHHHVTIQKNILENNVKSARAHILSGDLFENVTEMYDYILSNPPYINAALDRTEASVKGFEPSIALYGGTHGMEIIERIIVGAHKHLTKNGTLVIEHEPEQSLSITTLGAASGFSSITYTDQYNIERYTVLTHKRA